jgi:hypothetical protein
MAEGALIGLFSAGIGMSAMGQYQAGEAKEAFLKYDAALAAREAEITKKKTSYEVAAFRRQGEKFKAEQRATVGASSVRLEGSPLEALAESASKIERDALVTRYTGQVESQKYMAQSALLKSQAKYAKKAETLNAMTTLLTGTARLGLYGYSSGMFGKGVTGSPASTLPGTSSGTYLNISPRP